jgi:glucose/arabinose dehydrogenase
VGRRRALIVAVVVAVAAAGLALAGGPGASPPAAAGTSPGFTDVPESDPFFAHILWMSEEEIADGFPDGTFRPGQVVTRGAMAAFLYRAAGEPAVSPPVEPTFTDVPVEDPFYDEIEWLSAEGITTGFGDGTFQPGRATSRGAMAAYLYRFSDEPEYTEPGSPSFTDVALDHPFFKEVEWLVEEQVTTGYSGGTYRPGLQVKRGSMSAFIFRILHLAPDLTVDAGFQAEEDLTLPWDLTWTPDDVMLYTQRSGILRARVDDDTTNTLLTSASTEMAVDFYNHGETGLLGIVVDPDFETNRTFYTCQGEHEEEGDPARINVQVVSWTVDEAYEVVTRHDELIDNAEWWVSEEPDPGSSPGRHGGCRLRFGADGHLWIAAGDTACGTTAQRRNVHGGKVLRIDEDNPTVAPADNPFVGDGNPNTSDFVYTYGHRNPQGLALRDNGQMWSAEHGPEVEDEINLLQAGGNYGWNATDSGNQVQPCRGYNDVGNTMTNLALHPDAIEAAWTIEGLTDAPSGVTFLEGGSWGGWEGGMAVAFLQGSHTRVLFFTDSGVFIEQRRPDELDHTFGRLRTPEMGPDEDLFITTSNGSFDRIVRVSAQP